MVIYAKISPKKVNPRDIAGNAEEEEEEEEEEDHTFAIKTRRASVETIHICHMQKIS